jgi:hypothetical protein
MIQGNRPLAAHGEADSTRATWRMDSFGPK